MPPPLAPLLRSCAAATGLSEDQVRKTAELLADDNTVPFIVRYRSGVTGGLAEHQVMAVLRALEGVRALDERRKTILKHFERHDPAVSPAVISAVRAAADLEELEDIYMPYKPVAPKSHAAKARDAGLVPLFEEVWARPMHDGELRKKLAAAACKGCGGETAMAEMHLKHLIAERVASVPEVRAALRQAFWERAQICVTIPRKKASRERGSGSTEGKGGGRGGSKDGGNKGNHTTATAAETLDGLQRHASELSSHRILAINRAETEGTVKVTVKFPPDQGKRLVRVRALPGQRGGGARGALLEAGADDAFDRLLAPAMGRELRRRLSDQAELAAIDVFARNLRNLLLQRPLRNTVILGVDPGFRSGCKLAAIDTSGRLLKGGVIYPHPPQLRRAEAIATLREWISRHSVGVVAIGNGTASRETQEVVAEALASASNLFSHVRMTIVDEAGASVLSVSEKAAAAEPGTDVGTRGAASLARRLQDPLAELVKVNPVSLGVGMYQSDVTPKKLSAELAHVVQGCVCHVGVELNSASAELLQHVAGLTAARASAVLEARPKGGYKSRKELLKVKGIGPKSFEQAAGFLRITGGCEPLDGTAVHPESYDSARTILRHLGVNTNALTSGRLSAPQAGAAARDSYSVIRNTAGGDVPATARGKLDSELDALRQDASRLSKVAQLAGISVADARQVIDGLGAAWRDARLELDGPLLLESKLRSLEDVRTGEILRGVVRNVTPFGAFIDVGLKDDGLVHSSELCDKARQPDIFSLVSIGQNVRVRVLAIDLVRRHLKLSMRGLTTYQDSGVEGGMGGTKRPAHPNRNHVDGEPKHCKQSKLS